MSTPPINEGQLRDVLARVVPEAPDSVADPAPVIRSARARRRAQVAMAGGAVVVIAVAGVVGGRALARDDPGPQTASDPATSTALFTTAPCPEVLPANGPLPDLSEVTAVRYCAAGFNGFPAPRGAMEALISGMGDLAADVGDIPAADPGRCAAVDVIPSDSRLAFQLSDGSLAFVPATLCQDVETGGASIDGTDLTYAFLTALDAQRDDVDYEAASVPAVGCDDQSTVAPVRPGREHLVSALLCGSYPAVEVRGSELETLDEAWSTASSEPQEPCTEPGDYSSVVAVTDRGDVVRMDVVPCGYAQFVDWRADQSTYRISVTPEDLTAS